MNPADELIEVHVVDELPDGPVPVGFEDLQTEPPAPAGAPPMVAPTAALDPNTGGSRGAVLLLAVAAAVVAVVVVVRRRRASKPSGGRR